MEKLILKYIRQILGFISFISIIILTIYYDYSGIGVGEFISNKIILYFTYLFNPFVGGFSSLYRFLIIIFVLIFSIVSLVNLIKQNKTIVSIIQFFVLNLVAFLMISIEFRYFMYVIGILLPLLIISVLNHISLISFKNKLERGVPIDTVEKDFFDKLSLLVDKFLLSEDKKNVLKFESNYRELVKNYSTLSERSEKIAKSIKEFLLGILPRLQEEFSNTNELLKSLRIEHNDVKNLQNKIEQYENGYAYTILKNYFKSLLLVRYSLKTRFNNLEDNLFVDKLFSNYFSNFNVLFTVYKQGDDFNYETMQTVSTINSNDSNLNNKIESVLSQGYFIDTGEKLRVFEKANVIVYSFKKEEK